MIAIKNIVLLLLNDMYKQIFPKMISLFLKNALIYYDY